MSVTFASWNLENSFSKEARVNPVIEAVKRADADVVVFPEAFDESRLEFLDEVTERFEKQGYEVAYGPYYAYDQQAEQMRQAFMALSRIPSGMKIVQRPYRSIVEMFPVDEATGTMIQVVGAHFDDRNEPARMAQAQDLIDNVFDTGARVLMGDLNAMHASGRWARLLRRPDSRLAAELVPHATLQSIATRVGDMASGTTLELLQINGFNDADPTQRRTWPSPLPQVALDHIMVSDQIHVTGFDVQEHIPVSDHRMISATLHT